MSAESSVGVIGLGIMGSAIAVNLLKGGFSVVGYDIDAERSRTMSEIGVEIVDSPEAVVRAARVVLTSLPHEKALEATTRAIVAAGAVGRTIIEMSTMSLEAKFATERLLREAGHVMLDCPLSGTGAQAVNRDLTVYASGESSAIAASAPVFEAFAKLHFDLGLFGNGSRMKYVANLLVFIHNVAAAEALVLAMKARLDPVKVIEVVRQGAGGSRMLEVRGPMMAEGKFDRVTAGFPMYYKDIGVITQFAMALDCPTPLLSATVPIYLAGGAAYPKSDVAAVCGVLETMAGVKRGALSDHV